MTPDSGHTVWQSIVWHAPGIVIGLYFLSLQFTATINLSYLLLLAGAIFLLLAQPELAWRQLWSKSTALAFALFVSTVLSVYAADAGVVMGDIATSLIPGLLVYLILVLCVHSPSQLMAVGLGFLVALCAAAWVFFFASLHSNFSRAVQLIYFASQPLFLAANDVLMYAIFLPVAVWLARQWRGWPGKLLAGGYLLVLGLLSILLLSRLSMLVVAGCCFIYLGLARRRYIFYGLAMVVALAVAALVFDESFAHKIRTMDLARLRTWIAATAMFADAPWLGNGPGSFSILYPDYLNRMPESLRFGREIRNIGWAHSLFFEAAAEKGLLGLSIVVAYFVYLFTALKNRPLHGPGSFGGALRLMVAVCLVASCFELSLLRVWGVFIVYLVLGLVAVFAGRNFAVGDRRPSVGKNRPRAR